MHIKIYGHVYGYLNVSREFVSFSEQILLPAQLCIVVGIIIIAIIIIITIVMCKGKIFILDQ